MNNTKQSDSAWGVGVSVRWNETPAPKRFFGTFDEARRYAAWASSKTGKSLRIYRL